jgi:hypothetical protein
MLILIITILLSAILSNEETVTDVIAISSNNSDLTSSSTSSPYPTGTCAQTWFEATMISSDDIQDPSTDLENTIRTCRTLADWLSQAAKYPKMLYGRDPMIVLDEKCRTARVTAGICG